jgi:hypothetical protein
MMFALPTLTLAVLSMQCDERWCYPELVLPKVAADPTPPLIHLHPLEVPTEVRPWKPRVPPPKPPGDKK